MPHFFGIGGHTSGLCFVLGILSIPFCFGQRLHPKGLDWTQEKLDDTGKWIVFGYCVLLNLITLLYFRNFLLVSQKQNRDIYSNLKSRIAASSIMICDLDERDHLKKNFLEYYVAERLRNKNIPAKIVKATLIKFESRISKIRHSLEEAISSLARMTNNYSQEPRNQIALLISKQKKILLKKLEQLIKDGQKFFAIQQDKR